MVPKISKARSARLGVPILVFVFFFIKLVDFLDCAKRQLTTCRFEGTTATQRFYFFEMTALDGENLHVLFFVGQRYISSENGFQF
jgi:hypothetical protein